jgi:hypothetical protein
LWMLERTMDNTMTSVMFVTSPLDCSLKHAGSIIASTIWRIHIWINRISRNCLPNISQPTSADGNDDEEEEEEEEIQQSTTLNLVSRVETRFTLRYLRALRISGSKRDVLVVGSDSG